MKLPWLATRSRALALLVSILFIVCATDAQRFNDTTLGNEAYPGLSDKCVEALNTTVKDCPSFLAAASVDMPRLESSSLKLLCTSACRSSLSSVRRVIDEGCRADKDVIEIRSVVYPATFVIDRLIYTYNVSCTKDGDTGQFCDELYLNALADGTAADSCSDCSLNLVREQLNSPFGYHQEFAQGFESITSKCGAKGYAFTSPAKYALSTKPVAAPTDPPTCGSPYAVQPNDTCDSIATARNVSTYSIRKAAGVGSECNLQNGTKFCLPEPCTVYRVQYDDTCQSILDSVSGLRASDLLSWNPNINSVCTNLYTMVETLLCISPPGKTLDQVTTVILSPTTTQAPPTAVPVPTNAKNDSNMRCVHWYEIQTGDYCEAISIRQSISLRDFFFLNPSINSTDCQNLWLETSYCVKAVGDINTYRDYPYSTSPIYTLTSSNYRTTTVESIDTVKPIATPIVELPLAPDSLTEEQGCVEFANYRAVVPQRDQSQQRDVPAFTNTINNCDFVSASFGVFLENFLTWNPSLKKVDPCRLQEGFRYCATNSTEDEESPGNRPCTEVAKPYPGTVPSCSCFTTIIGSDAGFYLCEDIALDQNLTMKDLVSWNPWVGSEENCDKGIYANLTEIDERPVCIGVGGPGASSSGTQLPSATLLPTTMGSM